MEKMVADLAAFIKGAPTAFHAVEQISSILRKDGFEELEEGEKWYLEPGKGYYVTRNGSSFFAFIISKKVIPCSIFS